MTTKKGTKTAKAKKPAAKRKPAKKKPAPKKVAAKKADPQLVERFWKATASSSERSEARQAVRDAFPKAEWGTAGSTARALTEFRSFADAHSAFHTGAVIASAAPAETPKAPKAKRTTTAKKPAAKRDGEEVEGS